MNAPLSKSEMANWAAWKRATESVMHDVAQEISDATGLSAADFSVLTRLVEEGDGAMRQQRLADQLGWERSHLSRQLTRMEARSLLSRTGTGPERWIRATEAGINVVIDARGAHARAVRSHLLESVPVKDRAAFWDTVAAISQRSQDGVHPQ